MKLSLKHRLWILLVGTVLITIEALFLRPQSRTAIPGWWLLIGAGLFGAITLLVAGAFLTIKARKWKQ